ncbi:MAG TPA: hypothetical protein VG274_04880 [Rhizomicrobium sp.]|nr:hypothetical protein [Rhizomicrobium sp.]
MRPESGVNDSRHSADAPVAFGTTADGLVALGLGYPSVAITAPVVVWSSTTGPL